MSFPNTTSKRESAFASEYSAATGGDDNGALLAEANAKIARLESELQNQGLRLRKAAGGASDSKESAKGAAGLALSTQPPEGIPVQICAGLCFLSFLIAWFFF